MIRINLWTIVTIQTDKDEPQRKAFRITAKTVGGVYGTAGKTFSNVIGRKRRWRFETRVLANRIRENQIVNFLPDGNPRRVNKTGTIWARQAVFIWLSWKE